MGEKIFKCSECGKTYKKLGYLKKHIISVHHMTIEEYEKKYGYLKTWKQRHGGGPFFSIMDIDGKRIVTDHERDVISEILEMEKVERIFDEQEQQEWWDTWFMDLLQLDDEERKKKVRALLKFFFSVKIAKNLKISMETWEYMAETVCMFFEKVDNTRKYLVLQGLK